MKPSKKISSSKYSYQAIVAVLAKILICRVHEGLSSIVQTIADLLQKFDCEKDDLNKFLSEVFSLLAS